MPFTPNPISAADRDIVHRWLRLNACSRPPLATSSVLPYHTTPSAWLKSNGAKLSTPLAETGTTSSTSRNFNLVESV
ncbi:hypothetical protein [Micromonospora zhanjiangensis]|uniref:Uncharacterized protein n=1 Tax=Micromonospora zhanjiangensis TaxID=1522057 RepID=A0ABV8KW92_9ACTN